MKNLLFSSLFILAASFSYAQATMEVDTVENAYYLGPVSPTDFYTHDFNGEVIDLTPMTAGDVKIKFNMKNNTGSSKTWRISRTRIGVDAAWDDYLCWGLTGGTCIDAPLMDNDVWEGPTSPSFMIDVPDGDKAVAIIYIQPDYAVPGCGTYRYFLGDGNDPYQDSVDITVCFSLGMEEVTNSMSIAPNPATDNVTITGTTNGNLQIVNALGQVVYTEELNESTTVDVSSFDSGIYFAILTAEGMDPIKQKIVIE